jgi:hypothetical protein
MSGLTPTGVRGLDAVAAQMNLSRSELVERIGRGLAEPEPLDECIREQVLREAVPL